MAKKDRESMGGASKSDICFVDDTAPGITRRRVRHGWGYWDAAGVRIKDRAEIDRLNAIALPPAYRDAWFCPSPYGHIQAIGYDERGRKQYRYHADFRAARDAEKYDRCALFGRALPLLRARVESDLAKRGLTRDKAVAAVVRLLDLGRVRIGNETYARENRSFGATTLRNRHVSLRGSTVKLQYRAKSGKMQSLSISDQSLARFVRKCQDLPGQHLFQYLDDQGDAHPVTSTDVNAYIREAMGDDFSAKHFRTWGASVIAYDALCLADEKWPSLKALLAPVAAALGNTPAIARKSYVHPSLIALAGIAKPACDLPRPRRTKYLTPAERGLIEWLETVSAAGVKSKAA